MTEKLFRQLPYRLVLALVGATLLFGPLAFGLLGLSIWWLLPLAFVGGFLARDDIAKLFPYDDLISSYLFSVACFGGGALVVYLVGYGMRWIFGALMGVA